ncbi:MAG: TIGR03663 family protein [Candidatus Methanoperedens sp.]|nr:TIGR03663 family protein [Candidatus Methanoperedens sp.]
MNKRQYGLYLLLSFIIIFAFFLRLYRLDERVFHHDEAAVGYYTYKLFNDSIYSYDPSFHGPFMYYVTSEMYRLMGDTIYASRLLPAILGASMIFLLIPLRRYLGEIGTVMAAFFLALSPSFLYYSRFYREDIFISFFTLLALVCAVKYAEAYVRDKQSVSGSNLYSKERIFYLAIGGIAISSIAALKENAYIIMALIALFLFLFFIREGWYRGLIERLKRPDKDLLIPVAEALFLVIVILVVFSLFYTGKFFDLSGMKDAVYRALSHWYEMHRIQRMGGPYFYYIPLIALYELPVFIFGLLGMFYYAFRERFNDRKKEKLLVVILIYWIIVDIMYLIAQIYPWTEKYLPITYIQSSTIIFLPLLVIGIIGVIYIQNRFIAFLVFWTFSNFFIYSYVQEKVPWLVLNPLLPLLLIAAAYLGELLSGLNIRSRSGAALMIFLVISSAFFIHTGLLLNYKTYTDPAEPIIQASQPPQEKFSAFLNKTYEISSQYSNQSTDIQVIDVDLETQLLWYARHYTNVHWRVSLDAKFNAPLIIVHDSDENETEADVIQRDLGSKYLRLDSAKMSWYWFQLSDITPEYILWRKMDRPPSEYRFALFYKPKSDEIR